MSETESGLKLVFLPIVSVVLNLQVSLVHQQISLEVNRGVSLEVHL